MKRIIFIFILLFSISTYSQNENLIGKWENCKSVCNDMILMKNVCSEMEFKNDQTLTISNSGQITESFKWIVDKNQITFKKLNTEENFSFSESKVYILKFNENSKELILSEKENGKCYDLLSR